MYRLNVIDLKTILRVLFKYQQIDEIKNISKNHYFVIKLIKVINHSCFKILKKIITHR